MAHDIVLMSHKVLVRIAGNLAKKLVAIYNTAAHISSADKDFLVIESAFHARRCYWCYHGDPRVNDT